MHRLAAQSAIAKLLVEWSLRFMQAQTAAAKKSNAQASTSLEQKVERGQRFSRKAGGSGNGTVGQTVSVLVRGDAYVNTH